MKFLYLTSHIVILKRDALVVGKGIEMPVAYNAAFNI